MAEEFVWNVSLIAHLEENVRVARAFEPLSEEAMAEVRAAAQSRSG
jgi:hypothetical protein